MKIERLNIRLTASEKKKMFENAKKNRRTVTDFIKYRCIDCVEEKEEIVKD